MSEAKLTRDWPDITPRLSASAGGLGSIGTDNTLSVTITPLPSGILPTSASHCQHEAIRVILGRTNYPGRLMEEWERHAGSAATTLQFDNASDEPLTWEPALDLLRPDRYAPPKTDHPKRDDFIEETFRITRKSNDKTV